MRIAAGMTILVPALVLGVTLGAGPAGAELGREKDRQICVQALGVIGVILDGTGSRPAALTLTGVVIIPGIGGFPASGSGRLRQDGDLDFGVTMHMNGGLSQGTVFINGRLAGPDFDSGDGTFDLHGGGGPGPVTFTPLPCDTAVPDPA